MGPDVSTSSVLQLWHNRKLWYFLHVHVVVNWMIVNSMRLFSRFRIIEKRSKGLRVSQKLIMAKAKYLQEEKQRHDSSYKALQFSRGWLEKLMSRNGLSLRRRTTEAQNPPMNWLISSARTFWRYGRYVDGSTMHEMKNILAMDETVIWNDMISNSTVEKRGAHAYNTLEDNWPWKIKNDDGVPNCNGWWWKEETLFCLQERKAWSKQALMKSTNPSVV